MQGSAILTNLQLTNLQSANC